METDCPNKFEEQARGHSSLNQRQSSC